MKEDLFVKLSDLLNREQFIEAKRLIEDNLKLLPPGQESLFLKTELYGFLIDIGCESQNEEVLKEAIEFLELNELPLQDCITKSSYYYNLGNAKDGIGKIFYSNNAGIHTPKITKQKFQDPISLYWLAYKNSNEDYSLQEKILINLSNSLNTIGRIVEGLQFLDIVLKLNSQSPQALISRADTLHWLSQVTCCPVTTSLYSQIYRSYTEGIKTGILPPSLLARCNQNRDSSINIIAEHGFKIEDIEKEIRMSEKEFAEHSIFRKFCINNFLTLNEHSLYCNCVSTQKDDLQIGVKNRLFKSDKVPKLELLLNRIKSEFSFSRWLYYQSLQPEQIDFDVKFSELLDDELINSNMEMQRSSYRLCYGILDKIALGICKLYNLDCKRIHFETFWDDSKRSEKINQIKNIHLNALYSIANDLNTSTGELKEFKNWRNKLEHNLFVIKKTRKVKIDILKIFEDQEFVAVADPDDFQRKTLHLLQLTRAAIFSFVFCVRLETIELDGDNKNFFIIDFK